MKLQNEILNGESGISKKETRRRQEGEEVKVTNERMERRGEARGVTGRNNQRHDDSRSIFEGGGGEPPIHKYRAIEQREREQSRPTVWMKPEPIRRQPHNRCDGSH